MAKNWGKIITLDLAKVPKDWEIDKWLYFAKKKNGTYKKPTKAENKTLLMGGLFCDFRLFKQQKEKVTKQKTL